MCTFNENKILRTYSSKQDELFIVKHNDLYCGINSKVFAMCLDKIHIIIIHPQCEGLCTVT